MKLSFGEWCVRNYEDRDIPALAKYANNRKIWLNLLDQFPHPYTKTDARNWLQHVRSQEYETHFAIASEIELIGSIGFQVRKDVHCKMIEIGYWLGEPFWGKGIATRALRAMTDYAFTQHDLVRIQAGVFDYNPASARVLEKAGYTFEARLRRSVFKDGKIVDMLLYAILRDEWQALSGVQK
jgi:ribosomal-protein-alanine N-acetyltransferase